MHKRRAVIRRRDDERGAGLVEYALLLALIAVVAFSAVSLFGAKNQGGYGRSSCRIKAASDGLNPDSVCGP